MDKVLPRRASRLPEHSYTSPGSYFLTFCTEARAPVLGSITQDGRLRPSSWGKLAEKAVCAIPKVYPGVSLDRYVIMPDHVHLLLTLSPETAPLPDISRIIQQTKQRASKAIGQAIWQRGYYDHVIRNEQDYRDVWQYIENNPQAWLLKHAKK